MNTHQFALHSGHLPKRADAIARKYDCEVVRYEEPNGRKRGWITTRDYGHGCNTATAKAVLADLYAAGIMVVCGRVSVGDVSR